MKKPITSHIARTLFMMAYANAAEERSLPDSFPKAKAGEDWDDIAPKTPKTAELAAERLTQEIEVLNATSIETAYATAINAPGNHRKEPTPEDFGHCLAMEALGSGVAWADNHPNHNLKMPSIEVFLDINPSNPNNLDTLSTSGL
jgi:hypothetical protein